MTSRPRLLFVGTYLAPPASRAVGEDVADRLARAGWDVRLTSRRASRYARPLDMLATVVRDRSAYDVAQVDVYSGAAFRWAEWACGALRALGKPYVLTLHGGNLPAFAERAPGRVRRLLAGAAAVTAPSEFLRAELRHARGDVRLVPNPLDVTRYAYRARDHAEPRLVWLRAFHEIYNPALAVGVAARLAPAFPSLSLTMVGPDKDGSLARTRGEAARLGMGTRTEIVPGVAKADVPARLAAGDVFLNTTRVDNTPVSVLEAMASGLCVVSTNVGGIPHLLRHEHDALLVPPDDGAAMAGAVRRVLTEPALAGRLSRNARATAERFGWDRVLPQWETLLLDVARQRGRAADA